MASTPGYEETDHTACKQEIAALETKLRDSQVTIAEKDRVVKEKKAEIARLKIHQGHPPSLIDRGVTFLNMLNEKKYGPAVEYGLSILAGGLVGYGAQ